MKAEVRRGRVVLRPESPLEAEECLSWRGLAISVHVGGPDSVASIAWSDADIQVWLWFAPAEVAVGDVEAIAS